jgi:exodeoxyribonuclease-3
LKIVSYNVNGLRSALSKGLLDWVATAEPDVLCLQEIKAGTAPLDVSGFAALGYHAYLHPAQKPGYSGVATFSRQEPKAVVMGCGESLYDSEGRVLRLDFDGVSVLNTYMPSGTSGAERQAFKVQWLHYFREYVAGLRLQEGVGPLVIGGDYNCCQTPIDLHNPKANQNSPGYTPEERQWFRDLLADGFVDSRRCRALLVVELPGGLAQAQRGLAPRPPTARPSAPTPPAQRRPLARRGAFRPLPRLGEPSTCLIVA